jgi:Spy/CpxP family protein refolding chaperone
MKHSILLATTLLLPAIFIPAHGQPAQVPAQSQQGTGKFKQLARQLNLTPAQELKLIPILKAEAPKAEAIKANTSLPPLQKMEQLKALHDETDPQIRSILTPDQYQTMQGIRRQEISEAIKQRMNR